MKNLIFIIASVLFSNLTFAQVNSQNHYVNGYTKSNGTVVQGYYRTNPNSTINDNYSTSPNVNPYTGKVGTVPQSKNYSTTPYNYNSNKTYSQPAYKPSNNYSTPNSIFK